MKEFQKGFRWSTRAVSIRGHKQHALQDGQAAKHQHCPEEERGEEKAKSDTVSDNVGEVGGRHAPDKQPHVREGGAQMLVGKPQVSRRACLGDGKKGIVTLF